MNLEDQKNFILSGQMYNDLTDELVAAGVPCKVIREITEADKTGYRP